MRVSPSAPTPTLRGRSRTRQHKRWAASWRKSCEQKNNEKYRRGGIASSPALFESIRAFPRVGHGVGQAVDPHFDPHHFQRFCNKKASKTEVFDAFWSCWADSNCRPHPYQVFRTTCLYCCLFMFFQKQPTFCKHLSANSAPCRNRCLYCSLRQIARSLENMSS